MYWSPNAKRWLHFVPRRIHPSYNYIDVTFPRDSKVACTIHGIELDAREHIISKWKIFYWSNKKGSFMCGLITALCKWVEVPLVDTNEVLTMDHSVPPLLVRQVSTSQSKRTRKNRASNCQEAGESDKKEGDDLIQPGLSLHFQWHK